MENEDSYLKFDNIPNRITMFRIVLIPLILGCLFMAKHSEPELKTLLSWIAGWTFTVAGITDFFDGYIARKLNIVTVFGSFLDPIADKFLIISSLIMLLHLGRINIFVVIILVLREVYITSLRRLAQNEGILIPVDKWGKWKTTFQMIGIGSLMANAPLFKFIHFETIGPIAIYIAALLSAFSAVNYTRNCLSTLKKTRRKRLDSKKSIAPQES